MSNGYDALGAIADAVTPTTGYAGPLSDDEIQRRARLRNTAPQDVQPPLRSSADVVGASAATPTIQPSVAPPTLPTTLPGGAQPTPSAVSGIGQEAATPSPLGPVFQPQSRWALTKAPGNYQTVPNYGQASQDVLTGTPGAGAGLTKLGKLLTILRGAGMGAMVGSTQPTFGTGAMTAENFQNQQIQQRQAEQAHQMNLEVQRQNLAMLPLQRAWQLQNMQLNQNLLRARQEELQQRSDTEAARAERQRQLAGQVQKPIVSGDRLIRPALPSDDPSKVDENGYVDVGPAPTKAQKTTTPEQDSYQAAVDEYKKQGLSDAQIYNRMHPKEWQQQPGAGAPGANAPVPQSISQAVSQLPPDVQAGLSRFNPQAQASLMALAHGDMPISSWSARGTYKNQGGLTQEQAAGWARTINPSWDATLYPTKQRTNQRYTDSKQEGGQLEAFSNFLRHAGDAADSTAKWRQDFLTTGSPLINTPMNQIRGKVLGDPDYTRFVAALAPVKKEYMDFLNAHRAEHQADIQTMDQILNPASSPAQIEAALKQLSNTAILRLDSLDQNYRTATGGQKFPNLITPKAKQAAAKLGFGDAVAEYGSGGALPGYGTTAQQQAAPAPPQAAPAAHPFFQKHGGVADQPR